MIPLLFAMLGGAPGAAPPPPPPPAPSNRYPGFTLCFPGGLSTATISAGESIEVSAIWGVPSQPIDTISFQVYNAAETDPITPTQWAQKDFPATTLVVRSEPYSAAKAGWFGPGVYKFFAAAGLAGVTLDAYSAGAMQGGDLTLTVLP